MKEGCVEAAREQGNRKSSCLRSGPCRPTGKTGSFSHLFRKQKRKEPSMSPPCLVLPSFAHSASLVCLFLGARAGKVMVEAVDQLTWLSTFNAVIQDLVLVETTKPK